MCGIAGIFSRNGPPVMGSQLVAMTNVIASRGPDDAGHILIDSGGARPPIDFRHLAPEGVSADVGLGHRRLSIIDLSALGHQPMSFAGCTIVYNGEIYNYLELAEELRCLGHSFLSQSDTEVLLHAYVEWKAACLDKLNGIFSFVIWDSRSGLLFCARDRLGVKPFYYCFDGDRVAFCSEIKGLLCAVQKRPELNDALAYTYLKSGRVDHSDDTFFKGVRRLPAGHWLKATRENLSIGRFWEAKPAEANEAGPAPAEECERRFHDLFHDAIRLQMRADVPVGCCLSGGLDSSSIVSVAAHLSAYPMKTFTARYSDARMDEWAYAQAVHQAKPVEAYSVCVDPRQFWEELDAIVRVQEEPFSDPGVFVQWKLMQLIASQGVRVVLDGQGGDEILCGYAKYFYFALRDNWRQGRYLECLLSMVDAGIRGGPQLFNFSGARRYLPGWLSHRSGLSTAVHAPDESSQIQEPTSLPTVDVGQQQILDLTRLGLPALLRYEDKNSMAHSVEARVPFLDHRLVEFALGLPTERKIRRSESKVVLRRALRGEVPDRILSRRSKLGFGGYYDSWVQALEPELSDWLCEKHRPVDRFVDRSALRPLLSEGDVDIFLVLVLDRWMERFGLN